MTERAKYIKIILLLDELDFFHQNLSIKETVSFFRMLKQNIMSLYLFDNLIKELNQELRENPSCIELKKNIVKELDFVNHIRNKISGHLDKDLFLRVAQWQPQIFSKEINSDNFKILLSYISLFESAINSYTDKNNKHKLYEFEVDLVIDKYRAVFIETIFKLNSTSIQILKILKSKFEEKDIFFEGEDNFIEAKIAGNTDFNLKKKFDFNFTEINQDEKTKISDEFIKNLDFNKIEDVCALKTELEKVIKINS
jgi:hypothetical protein